MCTDRLASLDANASMPADPTTPEAPAPRAPDDAPDAPPEPPRKRAGVMALAVVVVLGLAMGAGAGAHVGGPMLARRTAGQAPTGEHAAAAEGVTSDTARNGPVHVLDNMVLNPAASDASRFLLISVALRLRSEDALRTLQANDAALRDKVLRILGARRVDELSDMARRDELGDRIRVGVDSLAGSPVVTAVYFPQFVIQ